VTAYKFLRAGRIGPFSGFEWPVGTWVEAETRVPCGAGIHACRIADLPFWLLDELWEIELGSEIAQGAHKVVAIRGRLVRRVDGWDGEVSREFASACVDRVRRLAEGRPEAEGHLADLVAWAPHASAAAVASLAARAREAAEGADGYDAERTAQSAWLAGRLGLHPAGG
jgi:hypothetical protein